MRKCKRIQTALCLVALLGFAAVVSAQSQAFGDPQSFLSQILTGQNPTSTEDIIEVLLKQQKDIRNSEAFITISPEFPGPHESVEARFTSYSFDVDTSYIIWTHNGKNVLSGRGERIYRFKTGNVGARESISVLVTAIGGEEYNFSKVLNIGGADLIWSARTFTPPEYMGKALVSPRSSVTVTAVPQFISGGRAIAPASLIYEWVLDDEAQTAESGTGKRTFTFYSSVATGAEHKIEAKISSLDKSIVGNKRVSILVHDPEVLVYEEETTGGPDMSRAITSSKMFPGEEKKFRALPYFFSENSAVLNFKWIANNSEVAEDKSPDVLSVKLTDDAAGLVNVNALVEGANNIIQRARTSFVINIL